MLNSKETKDRLAQLASYRALLMDKLQADYLSPQELFSIQDSLMMIDTATKQLTEYLEQLQKPISY
jgi:hypothetical protein